MIKKSGWLWIIGAILLFIVNSFTLGNQVFTTAEWAGKLSMIIGFIVCPLLLFIGVWILIMGKNK